MPVKRQWGLQSSIQLERQVTKIGYVLSKFIRSSTVDSIKYVQQLAIKATAVGEHTYFKAQLNA